jgi:hypothetical protein
MNKIISFFKTILNATVPTVIFINIIIMVYLCGVVGLYIIFKIKSRVVKKRSKRDIERIPAKIVHGYFMDFDLN